MSERQELNLRDDITETITKMAEGRSAARDALERFMRREDGILFILALDDMNIRGRQIKMALDFCEGSDARLFEILVPPIAALRVGIKHSRKWFERVDDLEMRRSAMVETVNIVSPHEGILHRAVVAGASSEGRKFLSVAA